ncbi:energy transducer TonB [Primorskyibacter sp. S87]|uniref:energy transducer TonB n=1 Tax=Primorskyibacter sp. S87 TaxID=3415126 RepID=UPI003C7C4231
MQTGTKISAIAHVTLIGWAFLGGVFRSEPLPFEVQEVSVISAEEFAALSSPNPAPDLQESPTELEQPEVNEQVAALPEPPRPEPEQSRPDPAEQPQPDPEPDPVVEAPEPDVPVPDTPTLVQPQPDLPPIPAPTGERPKPRPVDRVAPVPVEAPPPEATPDEVETPAVTADQGAETPQEEQEATAPEEATDQIATEANETTELAPLRSPRPPAKRPTRPEPTETAARPDTSSSIDDALAEAMSGTAAAAPAPSGPPMTGGERDAFRVAVQNCWVVDVGSPAASVTVVIAMSMDQNGKVQPGSLRLVSSEGGDDRASRAAFESARRAILRCQKDGYKLPRDKYSHWRDIELTFNPERMRSR